jgi:uracil-DNA glycosylase
MRDPKWDEILTPIINSPEITTLKGKLKEQRNTSTVYPKANETFEAFNYSKYDELKIVIIGAEPYNKPEFAHGLAFSSKNNKPTDELTMIFQEIHRDIFSAYVFEDCFKSYNLHSWAIQGILLLNAALSVKENEPTSHRSIGWDYFTSELLKSLNNYPAPIAFIFIGKQAQRFMPIITNGISDTSQVKNTEVGKYSHLVLSTEYPSPKNKDIFIGSGVFGKALNFLIQSRSETVNYLQLVDDNLLTSLFNAVTEKYKENKYPLVTGILNKDHKAFDKHYMKSFLKFHYPFYSFLNLTT